jgi:hypothetical protein
MWFVEVRRINALNLVITVNNATEYEINAKCNKSLNGMPPLEKNRARKMQVSCPQNTNRHIAKKNILYGPG